ncbi:MAG TPA: bifunctional phosphoribosylaminoimidazolecarboxamide formyltransferase/IMP cyclohydrolase, partial [Thermoanaerobaculia bacterium]|nr:bifunctional phosphoribosylaminoimidazolecarboxamide formyltransferase/IMP cyclohydrolase [Thermoanaerobaculia bacterium]
MNAPRRALLSVSDRTGLVEFARGLAALGFEIVSTGGTAKHLAQGGVAVTPVSDLTSFPEVFGGRVKTLHPAIFGGILFDRSSSRDVREAAENAVAPIDVVAVNLYPFEETVASGASSFAEVIEKIDIGGPSLLRAAAKNHAHVAVLCDPADYGEVLSELREGGTTSDATRRRLAAKVFRRTAAYDAAIARWLTPRAGAGDFVERLTPTYTLSGTLRYGENPHQRGALYVDPEAPDAALAKASVLQGKELSYNNYLDADAALFGARTLGPGGLTIIKHRIPSGAAVSPRMAEAFANAWESDPVAGFGGVVAYTGRLDAEAAAALTARFLEVVVVHEVADDAKPVLAKKPNLRVLTVAPDAGPRPRLEVGGGDGGLLVEDGDLAPDDEPSWRVVTKRAPTPAERAALRFAFRVVRAVVSNAIVVAGESATFGIGGGRTSRVD